MTYSLVFLLSYLVGSIPFGLLVTRALGLGDVRKIGSGNIGATNVLRTGNKAAAAATLILDAAKGAVPVLLARKGGKGVATFLGVVLALAWPVGLIACATWLLVAATARISSLSALVAAAMTPVWLWLLGPREAAWLGAVLAALVLLRHHANIRRMIAGTEPRIGSKR